MDELKQALAEIKATLATIAQQGHERSEEIDRLTRSVTRLVRAIEEEDTGVSRLEQAEYEERKRRHEAIVSAVGELRGAFKELVSDNDETRAAVKTLAASAGTLLSREQVVAIARMLVDELRQGLALRALGASPWPNAVPPSDAVPAREEESEGKKKKERTLFRLGGFSMSFPDPSLKTLWWLAKMVAMVGLSTVGGIELVKKIIKAAAGGE